MRITCRVGRDAAGSAGRGSARGAEPRWQAQGWDFT